jgi:hypothetical protein
VSSKTNEIKRDSSLNEKRRVERKCKEKRSEERIDEKIF